MLDAKNALVVIVVLLIVAFLGLYVPYVQYQRQERAIAPVSPVDGSVSQVVYTNRGFEPAAITIKVGTTVEWLNNSDKLMWVASDDHPSHRELPGFDQGGIEGGSGAEGLVPVAEAHAQGTVYRYTFLQRGSWKYHNHLVPSDRGEVVVE